MSCQQHAVPRIVVATPHGEAVAEKPSKHHPWMATFPWGNEYYYGTCADVQAQMELDVRTYASKH